MNYYDKYTQLLQWHLGVQLFDYNVVIDWALYMLKKGVETENMLILASFSKPVNREEIKPYVTGVLSDLKLEEKVSEFSLISNCYYHVQQIIDDQELRKNLNSLFHIHLDNFHPDHTFPFYLLHYAWSDLETEGYNYYYEGATLGNTKILCTESA